MSEFHATVGGETFTDRAAYEAHCKASGLNGLLDRTDPATGNRQRSTYRPIKPWRPPARKPFDPQCGEVGSWVEFTGRMDLRVVGQVWSVSKGGRDPLVWVADGERFWELRVDCLRPLADPADQLTLEVAA